MVVPAESKKTPDPLAGLRVVAFAGIGPARQNDRASWPAKREAVDTADKARAREGWTVLFAGTDACLAPALALAGAPMHAHDRRP